MALIFADRVKDSSTTTGTGTFTISGTAATGYQTFNSGIGVGNTCYYCIAGQAGSTDPTEWEVGLGTLASATTITRSSGNVLSSSSGAGTLVTFSAGVKDVFVTSPALWATSPAFTGAMSASSGAFGGATIGTSALAVTGNTYLGGQLSVGTTDTTTAYAYIAPTQSTLQHQFAVAGTNNFNGATVQGLNLVPTLAGGASTTTLYGVISNPKFTGVTGTVTGVIGVQSNPQYNSSGSITNFSALITNIAIGTSGTGAITSAYSNRAQAPTINAAAAITNFYQYFAQEAAPGSGTITNAYSYYGSQTTASGATNNWNLYMTGNAPNYLAGQLSIGSTTITNAFIYLVPSTTLQYQVWMQGTNTTTNAAPVGVYINPNVNGTSSATSMYGLNVVPIFGPQTSAVVGSIYAISGNCYLNTAVMPTTMVGVRGLINLASAATGGTVTNTYSVMADSPSIATSASTITNANGFYAANIAHGTTQTITNAYGFYGNQSTTGATNNWNLYMAGAAPNYLNSNLLIGTTTVPSTNGNLVQSGLHATSAAAPTIASATTIAPTTQIVFISGTTAIATITAPNPISAGGGQITLIPTGAFTTTTAGNIALASTAVVSKALIMTYDTTTAKWYPSY